MGLKSHICILQILEESNSGHVTTITFLYQTIINQPPNLTNVKLETHYQVTFYIVFETMTGWIDHGNI